MRIAALAAAAFLLATGMAAAQSYETPRALLDAFYEPYFTEEFGDDDSIFRSKTLQGLYDTDAAETPEGDIGALDFDPYIAGQDYMLTDFSIEEPVVTGDTATAVVTFKNFGEENELTYDLVLEDGGWKIDDLVGRSASGEYRLSEIFAGAYYWDENFNSEPQEEPVVPAQ